MICKSFSVGVKFQVFLILNAVVVSMLSGCKESPNPLLGDWVVDDERTLKMLKENGDKELIQCYENGLCGNYAVRFEKDKYFYLYPRNNDGGYIISSPAKYKLEVNGDKADVISYSVDGETKVLSVRLYDNGYYVLLDGYKEYLLRTAISNDKIVSVE